ncbi:tyrosinase cofactor [Streptomyces sp. NPDC127084]|uniref:apotyrosinase chaperone MelC1 n=1 Tax=Streptomyces sp. NPDC127084 TaxID=3347133 RepID=UPI003656CEB8
MSRFTRRQALGAAAGVAAAVAATGAAKALPAHADGQGSGRGTHHNTAHTAAKPTAPASFDEVYLGRRIQGKPASHSGGHHGHGSGHGGYTVLVDGKELHVMRNADGTWISVVNHYEPHPTPRAVARAAVVELQGAALVPLDLS